MAGGAVAEAAVIETLLIATLTSLVPAAGSNVFLDGPEMPNGIYELVPPATALYPFVVYGLTEHSMTYKEAMGGPQKWTDENTPNIWTIDLVDQLVSESGTTLRASGLFQLRFIDAMNTTFQRRTARYLIDGNGVGQATDCGSTVRFVRNPAGAAEMRAGRDSIVLRGTITSLSLPIPPTNT